MKLSIVVTTKNRKAELLFCIDSIIKSSFENFELLIIDDCSYDGTEKLTEKDFNYYNTKIYHLSKPLMMAEARNFGAKNASGEYILFIDDDNIIQKNMIENLVNCIDKYKDYGILGPRMFYLKDNKEYMSYQKINLFTGKTRGYIDLSEKEINESDGIPNVFLIRKEVFERCGYFDTRLMQTFTEPDLAFRARNFGYKCGICSKAITYHNVSQKDNYRPRGLGGNFPLKAYCLMRNRIVFIWRYGNILQRIIFLFFSSWFYPTIYSLLTLRYKRFGLIKLYWIGYYDGLVYVFTKNLVNSLSN